VNIFFYRRFEQVIGLGVGFGLVTAGLILSTIASKLRLGILSPEHAAATAPHFWCPSTTSTVL